MDLDYLAPAIIMAVVGVVGITATANASPSILASSTCNCVPSPPARFQELSVILLVFSAPLAALGVRRTNPGEGAPISLASGRVPHGPSMRSDELFALGLSLVLIGLAVGVPSLLVVGSPLLIGEGVGVVILGVVLASFGGRSR